MKGLIPSVGLTAMVFIVGLAGCQTIRGESLDAIVETVSRTHSVREIEGKAFEDTAKVDGGRFRVFDVRPTEEFEVGHLDGAVQVDPGMAAETFLKRHGVEMEGKIGVFYCSVGYRSSILAERIVEETGDSTRWVNLRGGIFGWYNDGRAVYDSTGITDRVHPYSAFWGKLIEKREGVPREDEKGVPGSK